MSSSVVNNLFLHKKRGVRIVAGIASSLSVIGSLLIIFTFCLFRKLRRTNARQILFHISLMDLGVALANLLGTIVYFDSYYYTYKDSIITWKPVTPFINGLCKTQAFVAIYSTYGSIFWTNWLAVYLYFTIVHHYNTKINKWVLWLGYGVCYLLPLGLCMWMLLTHRLGSSPYGSAGWCTIIDIEVLNGTTDYSNSSSAKDYFVTSFGYDLWIYLTFILIPVLFIGTRSHISIELANTTDMASKAKLWNAVHNVDYKFILIPLAFILLRIWTCILAITLVYSHTLSHANLHAVSALIYLAAIGDSGQGIANAIIFVLCTKKVRERLVCCKFQRSQHTRSSSLNGQNKNNYSVAVTINQ